jgi:hypothetical protein
MRVCLLCSSDTLASACLPIDAIAFIRLNTIQSRSSARISQRGR